MTDPPPRRMRLGLVGGVGGSAIGSSHIAAARLDGRWELVAGVFSRDPGRTQAVARELLIDSARAYADFNQMAAEEAGRSDAIDAVTICTPNDTHFEIANAFLDKGIHVICDKPLALSVEQARGLRAKALETGLVLAVTYTYSAYPMVRMARDMVSDGQLGPVRAVHVEYASHYQTERFAPKDWQHDPAKAGLLGVVAALGTHAFHLAEFVSGLRVETLAADLACLDPHHPLDDHAGILLRFEGGVRGCLMCTSVAHGHENGLALRILGSKGALVWRQEQPDFMVFSPVAGPSVLLTRGGPSASAGANRMTRIAAGHPEGYLEAFANLYTAIARVIARGGEGRDGADFPTAHEGARGVAFMLAAFRSAHAQTAFVPLDL
jgi:predicted dehydrogenase